MVGLPVTCEALRPEIRAMSVCGVAGLGPTAG